MYENRHFLHLRNNGSFIEEKVTKTFIDEMLAEMLILNHISNRNIQHNYIGFLNIQHL